MQPIALIPAQDEDTLARCMRVREAVFTIEKGVPKEIEVDEFDRLNGTCDHFLIRCEGKDAGALRCSYTPENAARIQRFCILKEYRGCGFGKAALEQVESYCRSRGCRAVELDAKLSAAGFYEKCGYETVSDAFIEAGVEHVKMRKELLPLAKKSHRMNRLKTFLRWLPALFIFGCNWYLSSQETIEQMPTFWNADKLLHCIYFAGLAFWVAFAVGTKMPSLRRIILPIIIVSVWGITDEIHQSFTPGRESSVLDWFADTLGAVVGSLVFFFLCKGIALYKKRKNAQA